MDPKIIKKTQDTLGKVIKKPPLTDKLLSKPPFRFLHDIMTSVMKQTGFLQGLYTENELNSENVKEKDAKVAFLQKSIDFVGFVNGKSLGAKPSKIVAGHEPERTNEFLQALATAVNAKVDNDDYVSRFLNKGSSKEEKPSKEKDREERKKREKEPEEKKDREKSRDRERSRDHDKKERREKEKSRDGEDRHKEDREERHKDREEKHRDDKHRDDRHKDREERHRRKKHRDEEESKEPEVNGEGADPRSTRPTSAKGSRRRRDGRRRGSSDEEDEPPNTIQPTQPSLGEEDLPPQIAASRKLNRPSSARPAPPKRKQDVVENEPAMRLGSGKPANVIVDDGKDSDDDNFVVEESAPPPPEPDQTVTKMDDSDDEDHGGLVKKILETKKELEGGSQQQQGRKTEVERPAMSDAQRRKQREQVQKEIDKLRSSIQTLTRSANPLGKIMDYVQEDLDSMQKELDRWKKENKEHTLALKREMGITDKAIEPLKAQLSEVDQAIKDQLDLIAACKSNIIRNDQKTEKMLCSIAKS